MAAFSSHSLDGVKRFCFARGRFWAALSAPCRHHRLKYGNLKVTKKSEAVTTDCHFKGKRRLAELRSMYKEAVQTDSECF